MKPQDPPSKIVPEEVIEAAWLEIGELPRIKRASTCNVFFADMALLPFVTAFSEDLSKDGAELAIYMFVAICSHVRDAFRKTLAEHRLEADRFDVKKVRVLDRLTGVHERWLERAAVAQLIDDSNLEPSG